MCCKQRPLGKYLFVSFVSLKVHDSCRFVNSANLPHNFQLCVHLDVGDYRQRQTAFDVVIPVFVKDGLCVVVEFNAQSVMRLLCDHIKETILDVGAFQLGNVRISQSGEAAELEHIAHTRKALLCRGKFP